ncbi:MAG TPA: ABC transporter substrate-binding protein [candidate division Zixibacteria bacterium]|nr:ABC transporter substrate-binding protein [candidate division Zixibacteria bacterium]
MKRSGFFVLLVLLTLAVGIAFLASGREGRPPGVEAAGGTPGATGNSGAWVAEVVFREESDPAKAIDMMEAGEIQVYSMGINDPELYRKIQSSRTIQHEISYGSNTELAFNPVGPTFPRTGELNPFHVPAIREAVNWLIDRDYIVEEIYRGLAVPRYLPLTSAFPDYARLADVARQLELHYAYNPEKAKEVISREMMRLGATRVDGRWWFRGKPVRLIFLIRPDDHQRREIGDYVATLLENLGFVVERQYKTATEASPIWVQGDPAEGRWHIYTGAWITLAVDRDQADNFDAYYTPRGRPDPLWQAYRPDPKLARVAERLRNRDYTSPEERKKLMAEALRLSLHDSVRVWLADSINVWPRRREVSIAADLAGGISGSLLWPYTIRSPGRRAVHFASPGMLTEPWNPIAGSNWIYDNIIMRSTQDAATLPDPFTGLYWPQRVKAAEVHVQKGLPVVRTHEWLSLHFVPVIEVPRDAWLDWDASGQRFVTVGERHPKGLRARTRTVVRYEDELLKKSWHDGTRISLADFVFGLILAFDRAKPQSPVFDPSAVPVFETFMRHFRGLRIVEEDPLVVEIYSDQLYPDAELIAASRAADFYTSVPWHELALGFLAERDRQLAFSSSKADQLKVEWMSYIAGPSLEILGQKLTAALAEGFIPYEKTLGRYVDRREAVERYRKLQAWRRARGHFWVGNGPFYLHAVYPVEKIVVVRRFEGFTDPSEKWVRFTEPRIADVEVSGPRMLKRGAPAEFLARVSFRGKPYPAADIERVRYLLFDSRGALIELADARPAGEGTWRIALPGAQTSRLAAGANRLEVVVTPRVVAVPSFKTYWFVTLPDETVRGRAPAAGRRG